MDAEFRDIFEMSYEKGFRAIIDEASWYLRETPDALTSFVATLSALPNHYERTMSTFQDFFGFPWTIKWRRGWDSNPRADY